MVGSLSTSLRYYSNIRNDTNDGSLHTAQTKRLCDTVRCLASCWGKSKIIEVLRQGMLSGDLDHTFFHILISGIHSRFADAIKC